MSISMEDIQNEALPTLIENFMSDLYCQNLDTVAKTSPQYAGLTWAYINGVDDFIGNFAKEGKIVAVEDDRTVYGDVLSCPLGQQGEPTGALATPLHIRLADHIGEHVAPVHTNLYTFIKDQSFDREKYHPPRINDREGKMQTLTLFLNDTDGELILFDKTYMGAKPSSLTEKQRFQSNRGTAVITDANRFFTFLPPSSENMTVIQLHFLSASSAMNENLIVQRTI